MANFFQASSSIDEIKVEELLLYRYSNAIDYVLNKDITDGVLFINHVIDQVEREKTREQWLVQIPWMQEYIGFEDYYRQTHPKFITSKTNDEILAESEEILRMISEEVK